MQMALTSSAAPAVIFIKETSFGLKTETPMILLFGGLVGQSKNSLLNWNSKMVKYEKKMNFLSIRNSSNSWLQLSEVIGIAHQLFSLLDRTTCDTNFSCCFQHLGWKNFRDLPLKVEPAVVPSVQ